MSCNYSNGNKLRHSTNQPKEQNNKEKTLSKPKTRIIKRWHTCFIQTGMRTTKQQATHKMKTRSRKIWENETNQTKLKQRGGEREREEHQINIYILFFILKVTQMNFIIFFLHKNNETKQNRKEKSKKVRNWLENMKLFCLY